MKYFNLQEKLPNIMGNVEDISKKELLNNINGIGKHYNQVSKYKITGSGLSSYLSVPIAHLKGGDKIKVFVEISGDNLECSFDRHNWLSESQQFIGEYRIPLENKTKFNFEFIVNRISNVNLHELKLGHFTNKIGVTTILNFSVEVISETGYISNLLRQCNNEKPLAVATLNNNTQIPNNQWTTLDNGICLNENYYLIDRDVKSFVAPSDGYYFVSAQATFEGVTSGKRFGITVVINRDNATNRFPNGNAHSGIASYLTLSTSGIVYLKRGNLLNIAVKQETGNSMNCIKDLQNTTLTVMQL